MKYLLFTFLFILGNKLEGQSPIAKLDTMVNLHLPSKLSETNGIIFNNCFYYYIADWNSEGDSVKVERLNLKTFKKDTLYGALPGMHTRFKSPEAKAMCINEKYAAFIFNSHFVVFRIENDFKMHCVVFDSMSVYDYNQTVYLMNDNLLFTRCYDIHPKASPHKTILKVFNIPQNRYVDSLFPAFDGIYFSHFEPNHWIDATSKQILFSQTCDYKIDIYDAEFHKLSSISRDVPGWQRMDSTRLKRFKNSIPSEKAKVLIDSLSPYEDKVSRVEGAWFLDNNHIWVRYIPANNKANGRVRKWDEWELRGKDWVLIFNDIVDNKPDSSLVLKKDNFPLISVVYPNFVCQQYFLTTNVSANIPYDGKKWKAWRKEINNYYIDHEPERWLFIYKVQ